MDKCEWCSVQGVEDSITLVSCLHVFCRPCLGESFGRGGDEGFKCPVEGCQGELVSEEVLLVLEGTAERSEGNNVVENNGVLRNARDEFATRCSYCKGPCRETDVVILEKCIHMLCRDCVKLRVLAEEGVEVRCPMVEVDGCGGVLEEYEIRSMVTQEEFDTWLDRSVTAVRNEMNVVTCATPGCKGLYSLEEGRRAFQCSLCDGQNCVKCKTVHEDMTCEKYEEILRTSKNSGGNVAELMKGERMSGWMQVKQLIKDEGLEVLDSDLLVTIEYIECKICFSLTPPGDGVILQDCLHTYCRECLVHLIRNCENPDVKCPFVDGDVVCQNFLKPRELKCLVSTQEVERLLSKAAMVAEGVTPNAFHCLTPDCPGWCEIASDEARIFKCFVCNKNNCLQCKIIHEGSCADYKRIVELTKNADRFSAIAIQELIRTKKAMKCPGCSRLIMKNGGCNHMTCTGCQRKFDWLGLGQWDPTP